MATAKMKHPLLLFTWLCFVSTVTAQYNIGQGINREIFFLNLEDGYFGCQVNESTEVLQLFELSKLCDGQAHCFLGSDENVRDLKCTNDCPYTKGYACVNGACLDSNCHCNDGFGGCGCDTPDENECKFRPCDVFASCTNTLGSFFCSCFPGYQGDGTTCEDIDECLDPALAAKCVDNAECCNLPAHYTCKCKPGYTGDGYRQCVDIDECRNPDACGLNAICSNFAGNYTCTCPPGYQGNPYDGCLDLDECSRADACGPKAVCTNMIGGHNCACAPGLQGDPYSPTGCLDINECASSPCASGAKCFDGVGNYSCTCPQGFVGNPYNKVGACRDIDECSDPRTISATAETELKDASEETEDTSSEETIETTTIITTPLPSSNWSYPCGRSAECVNIPGSYKCICPEGFTGLAQTSCYDINECGRPGLC